MKTTGLFGLPSATFAAFAAVTAAACWLATTYNQKTLDEATETVAIKAFDTIQSRLQRYQYGLRGARGVVITAGEAGITRQQFERYSRSRDLAVEFPGAKGFGFIRLVPQAQESAFVAMARRDDMPNFTVRQLAPHEGERYIIQYIEPLAANLPAVGLDIASESNRRTAAVAAMQSGEATLSGPITLVQATGKPSQSFLLLLPVYRTHLMPTDETQREQATVGWVYTPLSIQDVLGDGGVDLKSARLELQDISYPANPITFFENGQVGVSAASNTLVRAVYGRAWQLSLSPTPDFVAKLRLWPITPIAAGGGLISLLMAFLAHVWNANRQRTRELAAAQTRLAAIVESSIDGIIGMDPAGSVTSWNQGAERIFGYTAQEAVGQTLASLTVPAEALDEEDRILARVQNGKATEHFHTRRRCKDGQLIDVSVSASPVLDSSGAVVGASKTVRDITAQKAAEASILSSKLQLEAQVAIRTGELEAARKTLRTVLDALPSMIGYWDRNLINQVANHAYHDWFGLDHESLPGKHISEVLGPELFALNAPRYEAVLHGHEQIFERDITDRDGKVRHSLTRYIPDAADGEVKGFYVVVHDISEQVQSRSLLAGALRENQILLNTMNEQLLYSVTNRDGAIIEVNDQFCNAHGFDRDELLGHNHNLLSSGHHSAEYWHSVWETLRSGHAWRGEVCNQTKAGGRCWFDTVIAPHLDDHGNVERYVALRVDITERKAAEEQLAVLNLMFSNVLNAATEISVIATDVDGIITVFNTGAQRMLGYTESDVNGVQTPALFHDTEEVTQRSAELSQLYGESIVGFGTLVYCPTLFGVETRVWTYIRKDGVRLQVSLTVTAMRGNNNELLGYLGLATDVTDKLKQEQEFAAARDQLMLAADIAKLGVWTWTLHDNALDWNQQMFDLYAQPNSLHRNGLSYEHWRSRVHPDDVVAAEANLNAAMAGKGVYDAIFRVLRPDGTCRYVQGGAYVEHNAEGNVTRVTGINLDITERQEFEASLLAATKQAQEATLAKGQFLANMSHEIRTPMNAVLGMLQLLRQTSLDSRQADYAAKAQTAARSLLGLLNDILDFSKIDAGKMQVDLHPFELEDLMSDLAVVLSGNLGDKNIELMFEIDTALPRTLIGDQLRLQQILINLAGNAIKFTRQGHVVVRLKTIDRREGAVTLRIGVVDTGIGISPDQLARIFDGFNQAEASTTRRYGGTGLGLFISKRLVEIMGGELYIDSTLGQGSHFWFDISLATALAGPILSVADTASRRQKILVVDDSAVSGEILCNTVASLGWHADYASGGSNALELVKLSLQQNATYDAILMDWRMPEMDGVQAAAAVHQLSGHPSTPVIVMVTAFGREVLAEMEKGVAVPFAGFLSKPVTPQQLVNSILRAAGSPDAPMSPAQSPPRREHPLQGLRLLVVEDNAINRQVAYELLSSQGATVSLAESGLPGVAMATEKEDQFDVVLMDLQMPDIDGLEATRRIRADSRFQTLPILAMTANASASDRAECLAAGMNEHVGKPIDIATLTPLLLALAGGIPSRVAGLAPITADTTPALIEPLETILQRLGGNHKIYRTVLDNFDLECERLTRKLTTVSQSGTMRELAQTLHALKGMASTVGASALAKQASDMEALANTRAQGPASDVMPMERVHQYTDLMARSLQLLNAAFNAGAPLPKVATAPQRTWTPEDWRREVDALLGMLSTGNMQALDMMEAITSGVPPMYESFFDMAAEQIRNLEFDAAALTIQTAMKMAD